MILCSLLLFIYLLLYCILISVWVVGIVACPFVLLQYIRSAAYRHARLRYIFISVFVI